VALVWVLFVLFLYMMFCCLWRFWYFLVIRFVWNWHFCTNGNQPYFRLDMLFLLTILWPFKYVYYYPTSKWTL
jgi:hypothetical protein